MPDVGKLVGNQIAEHVVRSPIGYLRIEPNAAAVINVLSWQPVPGHQVNVRCPFGFLPVFKHAILVFEWNLIPDRTEQFCKPLAPPRPTSEISSPLSASSTKAIDLLPNLLFAEWNAWRIHNDIFISTPVPSAGCDELDIEM